MKHYLITGLLILVAGLFTSLKAQSQIRNFPDSIRIEFPDHRAIVTFEMKYFMRDQDVIKKFPETFKTLLVQIRKGLPEPVADLPPQRVAVRFYQTRDRLILNSPGGHTYQPAEEKCDITIEEIKPAKTTLTVKANTVTELLPPGWEVFIAAKEYKITLYGENFQSLESLTAERFDDAVKTITDDPSMKKLGRSNIISRIIVKDHAVANNTLGFIFPGDYIGFHPGAGVGVLYGQVYPEVSLKTALYFSDRFGTMRKRLELTYDMRFNAYFYGAQIFTSTSSFLSLSYARNFRKGNERARWTAVGVSYLLNPPSELLVNISDPKDHYGLGGTVKLFVETDIGNSKLNLVPELYLTDNYSKFQFGMKLAYRF
jgi:hypothetical protein